MSAIINNPADLQRSKLNDQAAGLEIRVVLWPQSTRTSGGPPDSAMWWSGGLMETKLLTINFDNIFKMCTDAFYDQYHLFSIQFIYCKVFSNVLYMVADHLSAVSDFIKTIVLFARSGPPTI